MSRVIRTALLVGALTAAAPLAMNAAAQTATVQTGPIEVNASTRGVIPEGQEMEVRLRTPLSSETAKVEERFEATTSVALRQNGRVLVPAGALVRGVVSEVDPAGRGFDRKGTLTLSFDQMTVRGRVYPIRGVATQVYESRGVRDEIGTAGAGAGIGGVIGGLLGGVKGAVLGAVLGAGGAIIATDGKDIELPAGSVLRVRLDSSLRVR